MKLRLDKLLVQRGLADSRHQAQGIIGAGQVRVNGQLVDKAGSQIAVDAPIAIVGSRCPFVSRGGTKLAAALKHFAIDPTGWICADIGASTGGFTDCLLQNHAAKVYAVDVGYGQLAWKLRQDERVVVMERCNARHLAPDSLADPLDLAVIDASFISLKLLLPPLLPLLDSKQRIVALIKPQFEAGRDHVKKGGVVRDTAVRQQVCSEITAFAAGLGLVSHGVIPSPILGPKGNQEFLIFLTSAPLAQ